MVEINFTRTWEDRSPARGFQFAFRCESCNSYYSSALVDLDNRQPGARDHALGVAAQQVQRDEFGSCVVCRRWVCAAQCWSLSEHTCAAHRGQAGGQPQQRPRHAQLDQSTEAWNPDMRDELRSMLDGSRPSVPGHPAAGQPLAGPPQPDPGHFRPSQPPAGSPPPYRPQQADQATQAWAPNMRDELKSMLNDNPRPSGSDQSTEAWNPNMQDELRSMLGQQPQAPAKPAQQSPAPAPSHGQTPPPAQAPKFCSQCGNALTGRFCGRCGTPAY